MPKIKNIIIFAVIAVVVILIYVYFIKPSPELPTLVSSQVTTVADSTNGLSSDNNSAVAGEFLALLLNVKSIKLNDAIFSDNAFISLHDSSITLIPDGTEGRVNPFAPLGSDPATISPVTCAPPLVLNTPTNTCVNPPPIN